MTQDTNIEVVEQVEPLQEEQVTETATVDEQEQKQVDTNVDVDIDDMSKDEFNDALAQLSKSEPSESSQEASNDETNDNGQEVDLNVLYRTQMDDSDSVLDKPIYIKINGEVMEVNNVADIKNLAELGGGAKKAFQRISEDTKTIDYLQDNNISRDDLDALIRSRGVEPMVQEQASVEVQQVDQLIQQIETSPIGAEFLEGIQMLPSDVTQLIGSNPDLLADLANEYSQGYAQQVMPHVRQEMAIKQMSFVEAYKSVGLRMMSHEDKVSKVNVGAVASQPKSKQTVATRVDIDNMSASDFEKYIAKMR